MGLVVALVGVLYADAGDDLQRAKSDLETVKSHYDDVKGDLDKYLAESRKLRAMDADDLKALIAKICASDIERNNDEAT